MMLMMSYSVLNWLDESQPSCIFLSHNVKTDGGRDRKPYEMEM